MWKTAGIPAERTSTSPGGAGYQSKLADLQGPVSGVFGPWFDSVRAKMNLIRGVDVVGKKFHNRSAFLCASCDSDGSGAVHHASVDEFLANSENFIAPGNSRTVLRLCGSNNPVDSSWAGFSFDAGLKLLPFTSNERAALDLAFKGGGPGAAAQAAAKAATDRQFFVLDKSTRMHERLLKSPRLGALDKERLNAFVTQASVIKRNLAIVASAACRPPTITPYVVTNPQSQLFTNLHDIAVAAMACDAVRIVCLYITNYSEAAVNLPPGVSDMHLNSHSDPGNAAVRAQNLVYNQWISKRVAELLTKMNAVVETDGSTLLDNSLVVWGNEMGNGGAHRTQGLPIITAGGLGGRVNTGNYLDYRQRPFIEAAGLQMGVPYSRFLCSVMLAAGMQPGEFEGKGEGGGFGGWSAFAESRDMIWGKYEKRRTEPLPGFLKI